MMLPTCALLFFLFIFPAVVFPTLVQQPDSRSPIRRAQADVINHCGKPLAPNTLLAANRTVVSLFVKDDLVAHHVLVSIGPKNYTLSIDTGSANTFVGAIQDYVPTSLSVNTTQPVRRSYVDGSHFTGFEFFDNVTLGCVTLLNQSIGVAKISYGFGTDGILGIGPTQLTQGTLFNEPEQSTIPTITDNLAAQNFTPSNTIGLSFKPWNESNRLTSEITLGGIDQSNFVGPLIYVPITNSYPANHSIGINASIFYDGKLLLSNGVGIIDSGSTNLQLATDVLKTYTDATGAKNGSDRTSISTNNYNQLKPLVFVIGNSSFALTPDGQRYAPSVGRKYFLTHPSTLALPITSTGNNSGNGNDFVLGKMWLRRFYVVYDSDNQQVGVANTSYTNASYN